MNNNKNTSRPHSRNSFKTQEENCRNRQYRYL